MAAAALALSNVKTRSVGNRKQGTATLTLTASTSAYVDGGISLPTGWSRLLSCPTKVEMAQLTGPLTASTIDIGYFGKVDIANGKVALFGGASSAAEDVPLEELTTANLTDGTYTTTLLIQGY